MKASDTVLGQGHCKASSETVRICLWEQALHFERKGA